MNFEKLTHLLGFSVPSQLNLQLLSVLSSTLSPFPSIPSFSQHQFQPHIASHTQQMLHPSFPFASGFRMDVHHRRQVELHVVNQSCT
ncbi:hypothetical protein LguiA_008407 [Lonicera macranthoides]